MVSPNSVLPPQDAKEQDNASNPSELAYREGMGSGYVGSGIDQVESFANDSKNHDDVRDGEENPDENLDNGLYKPSPGGKRTKFTMKGMFRKKGALTAIISLVFGAGLGFSALLSPSLLIIHTKEIMTEKFNTQLSMLDIRSTKLFNAKIDSSTTGLCSKGVSLRCKFSTMSEKQVTNFKNAGITVEPDVPTNGTRTKPTGYVFEGEHITASDFAALSKSNVKFKAALRLAYNPKFSGFTGKAWTATSRFLGIDKSETKLTGTTDKERMASLNEKAKNGVTGTVKSPSDFLEDGCEKDCAQAKADEVNATAGLLEEDGKSGKAAKVAEELLSSTPASALASGVKITGAVDTYCQAYAAINAVGYAAKAVRAVQLARYAMVFMSAADEIKAGGNISPETVAFLGGVLTEVTYDVTSTTRSIKNGAGTDSLGFKYAQFGDTNVGSRGMSIANRYLAGGGFTGELIQFSTAVSSALGGRQNAANVCGTLANPFVQGGSIILGVAALFVPGANVLGTLGKAAVAGVVGVGMMVLPSLLADIIAGTGTKDITGEASTNAIASGAGKTMSDTLAGQNGAALMSKPDALTYANLQQETIASYGNDERLALSPLDPTSQYTFLGNIVSKLIPIASTVSDGSTLLASFGSLFSTSMASIIPKSSALTTEQQTASLNACQDQDVIDAGYATDVFCNVVRGIPPKYLNKDPNLVVSELLAKGQVDPTTELPIKDYKDFIAKCIESTDSPGWGNAGGGFDADAAKHCMINDDNANYFLNYADSRVEGVISGDDSETAATTSTDITDKKVLAQKIVDKNKVKYLGDVQPILADIASGKVDASAEPCGININILKIIDVITDSHSITISDINRQCTGSLASSTGSRHYAGNGSALDIAVIDGVATNGRDANAVAVIGLAMPILTAAAAEAKSYSQVGQIQCGTSVTLGASVRAFNDSCNHVHLDVPAKSDPNLKYSPGW